MVLCFVSLGLLLGIVLFAMFARISVKLPTGLSEFSTVSYCKSVQALSEKAFQSALESFQLQLVSEVVALYLHLQYQECL